MQVSEILDSELLGEGLIPTLQHAHDMLLVENPQTVPYQATIYGQVHEQDFLYVFMVLIDHFYLLILSFVLQYQCCYPAPHFITTLKSVFLLIMSRDIL